VQGRLLSVADIEGIRALRAEHPQWNRRQLSEHLAQQWQWRNGAGRFKDMAARTLLLKLEARGLIDLPAPRNGNGNGGCRARPPQWVQGDLLCPGPAPVEGLLSALRPVTLEWVETPAQRRHVTQLLREHHYRGYSGAVGENVQYLATDCQGRELAVMVFGAAAWKVACRDAFIGWSPDQREARLGRIVNQQRFLILPWVCVAHLASHLLALAVRRLGADWQHRYGHPVWLVETFVEEQRFAATSYKAAGWIRVGQTTGRTRQDRHRTLQTPAKGVWLKPLHPGFRQHLNNA
jgi:Domain of unknown function (DUF4338)